MVRDNIRDRLVRALEKARAAELMRFEPRIDLEIIAAHKQQRPSVCSVVPSPIPLYRCYFIENQTIITYMTHLLKTEYEIFERIVSGPKFQPCIDLFVITDSEIVSEQKINSSILAHLLFRFHHRIAKNYITDELFLTGEKI